MYNKDPPSSLMAVLAMSFDPSNDNELTMNEDFRRRLLIHLKMAVRTYALQIKILSTRKEPEDMMLTEFRKAHADATLLIEYLETGQNTVTNTVTNTASEN